MVMGSLNKKKASSATKKGIFFLLLATLAWSFPNVMIRMLRSDFDVYTQNFYRYAGSTVFMFAIGFVFMRKKMVHAAVNLKMLLIPSLIMAIHQIFYTTGVFMTSAVISSLIGRINAIIIPALSYIFYADERQVVKNKSFILGALIALFGVVGVVLGKGAYAEEGFNVGVLLVMLGTITWSFYAVWVKKIVRSLDPLAIISYVSLLSVILFLPLVLKFGDIGSIRNVSAGTNVLLFVSGILGVGVGNVFYNHAVKYVGTSISSVFFLLLPFCVGILGFIILGETLTVIQTIAGVLSILGCWVVAGLAKTKPPDTELD
jgi:drug/metabolite transporter (DMT)-like permease